MVSNIYLDYNLPAVAKWVKNTVHLRKKVWKILTHYDEHHMHDEIKLEVVELVSYNIYIFSEKTHLYFFICKAKFQEKNELKIKLTKSFIDFLITP